MSDEQGMVPSDMSVEPAGLDWGVARPPRGAADDYELGWIAHESEVARAQLMAQAQHNVLINRATTGFEVETAWDLKQGIEQTAAIQRSIEDPGSRRVFADAMRELYPAYKQAMVGNFKDGAADFGASRRTFEPPPKPKGFLRRLTGD